MRSFAFPISFASAVIGSIAIGLFVPDMLFAIVLSGGYSLALGFVTARYLR